jgi:CheY-like chemotaxis protein
MTSRKPRILIVDDEPDILWSLSLLLQPTYDVATAEDGQAALREIEQSPFDAIVLDLMMPVMDGAGLKRELDARGSTIPIIIVSAFSDVAERARSLGVRHHLPKPIDVPRLEAMIASVVAPAFG